MPATVPLGAATRRTTGFARAAHPGPCAAVTAFAAALAAAAGVTPGRVALLAAAVLAGQLSVGWANDWRDAPRDRAVGRADKPVVSGAVTPRGLRRGATLALGAALALTAPLGAVPLAAHGVALGAGWAYDLGVKATALSPLPYAAAFALLPVVVAGVAGGTAPAWAVAASGLVGAGAHFTNAVGDLDVDARTGVRSLPQLLGARGALVAAAVLLGAGAALVLAVAPLGGLVTGAAAGALGLLLLATVAVGRRGSGRAAFRLTMLLAGGVVALVVLGAADALA